MNIQNINVGYSANDGTGDDLREAFIKVNNNFASVQAEVVSIDTIAENLGSGNGIFAQKSDNSLQFKSLQAGAGLSITPSGSSLTISSLPSVDTILAISEDGSLTLGSGIEILRIYGGQNAETRVSPTGNQGDEALFVDVLGEGLVELDPAPKISNHLNANNKDIVGAKTISALNFVGSLQGLVYGIDIRDIDRDFTNLDLGKLSEGVNNTFDLILAFLDFDLGTFSNPIDIDINGGTI